jgi:acetoin utilization protein AcuB
MKDVGSVMTPAPVSVSIEATLREAEDLMIDRGVRHLPVLENGTLVGVVSDRDLASGSEGVVRDVCALDLYTVEPDAGLDEVLEQMAERQLGCVVVTRGAEVAGIFTATDACRCFAEELRKGR